MKSSGSGIQKLIPLLAMIALAGCGTSIRVTGSRSALADGTTIYPASPAPAPQPSTAPVPFPDPAPAPAPSVNPLSPGSSNGTGAFGMAPGTSRALQLDNGDGRTRFYIYVPSSYAQSAPVGLVMLFHGVEGTNDPKGFFQLSQYYGNEDRFILVAPTGDVNDGGSGAWCQPFAREIMEAVRGQFNIDNSRQYMAAVSGGCLPGILFALASTPGAYVNYCGQTVKAGFQAEFAAVGFVSPAYSPNSSDLSIARYRNTGQLGFTPAMWVDYGEKSNDGANADALSNLANNLGYFPNKLTARPGEGHAPKPPYSFVKPMFDLFAAHSKK